MKVSMTVNGTARENDVEPRTLLVQYVREHLGLTGTNIGCDTSSCGACTIHVNGESVKSCTMLAVQADGATITTIEGLANADGSLSILQQAFSEKHGLQCGFCTPGFITTAHALLTEEPDCDADRIREVLSGNICRCTGYGRIFAAVDKVIALRNGGAR